MKIKVLLLKDVAWVGWKWQIKEVADTYARNVLIRQWLAKIADKKTIKDYEKKMKNKHEKEIELKEKKESVINWIKMNWLTIKVSASENWHLYEKIDIKHIKQAIFDQYKVNFENKEIEFPEKKVNKIWNYEFIIKQDWKKIWLILKVLTK